MSRSTQAFIGLMILFLALTFVLPVSNNATATYQLTDLQYRYLLLLVKVPLIAAWSIAFYGYRRLYNYAQRIADAPEGEDFAAMARGTGWMAWGFAIPPVISSFLGIFADSHPAVRTFSTSFNSYLYLIVTVIALSFIAAGIRKLARRSKVSLEMKHTRFLVFALVGMSVLFCSLIAGRLHGNSLSDSYNAFYVPNIMVWTTIAVPYLYAWGLGIVAAVELILVARRTSGIIYKQALQYLATGLITLILTMSALQYFRAIIPRNGHVTINGALIMIFAIYAVNALGGVLLAIGAKRLKRIEEI